MWRWAVIMLLLCVNLIVYVWSVTGTVKRSCACEISFNHTYLHGNGYWLEETATQLCHCSTGENVSHLVLILFSKGKQLLQDSNVILIKCTTKPTGPPSMKSTSWIKVCKGEDIKSGCAIKLFHMKQRKCAVLWCRLWNSEHKDLKWAEWKITCASTLWHTAA